MYFSKLADWCLNSPHSETTELAIDLFILLLAQIPTRRCIRPLLESKYFVPILSTRLSTDKLKIVSRYMHFPVDDFSAEPLSYSQVEARIEEQYLEKLRQALYQQGLKESAFSLHAIDNETKINRLIDSVPTDIVNSVFFIPSSTEIELVHAILVDKLLTPKKISKSVLSVSPRFPTETDFNKSVALSRHVLTTQYLSLPDYMERNLELYKEDVFEKLKGAFEDSVPRLGHKFLGGGPKFDGSSRMIAPVNKVEIITVARDPFTASPSSVKGEIVIDLKSILPNVREEWDKLRNGDVLFLITLGEHGNDSWSSRLGIQRIRGCTVLELVDGEGNLISSFGKPGEQVAKSGDKRIARVDFDPITYASDLSSAVPLGEFQIVLRLKSSETVFKSVLSSCSTVRFPEWFSDFFLGYGSPDSLMVAKDGDEDVKDDICQRFGFLVFHAPPLTGKHSVLASIINTLLADPSEKILLISKSNETLNLLLEGINLSDQILKLGGSQDDVFSRTGRINALLAKRLELLGRVKTLAVAIGLSENVADDFSYNCDNARQFLELRVKPINELFGKTCESIKTRGEAEKWLSDKLLMNPTSIVGVELLNGFKDVEADRNRSAKELAVMRATRLLDNYSFEYIVNPFKRFRHESYEEILKIFSDLEKLSPFEILRTVRDRSEFLLTCFSRVIAGTSTSVMMNRDNLMGKSDARFSTVIVDDANQMLDLETCLCLSTNRDSSRLRRIILVGDDEQLGPVVASNFTKSNFATSLFARMKMLGAPVMNLTDVVECGSVFIGSLLQKVYKNMVTSSMTDNTLCPPALCFDSQFVHVGPYLGQGESEPSPGVYQNLGEAEFIVALYMLMRLNNVKAESISILTAYTGQKNLIHDVVKAKCDWNPIFGQPRDITTIDQFQGQSNDIVLVSLVRTENPGHMRDPKRWVTAIGTAKHALYIFGNREAFAQTGEKVVEDIFLKFEERPQTLDLMIEGGECLNVDGTQMMLDILQAQIRHHLRKSRI